MTGIGDGTGSTSAPDSPLSLRGQVAVVTGASGGLGAEIAQILVLHGARVIGWDLPPDAEEPWLEELRAHGAREATLRMRATRRGAIVNVASVAGLVGVTHLPAYTASKHGVVGLTKNLATDLAPMGVRVNAVAPGIIRTPLTEAYFGDESSLAGLEATVPLGAGGTPADVGNAVLFLASPMAAFVTGVVLPVDGGWVAEKGYSPGTTGGAYTSSTAGSAPPPLRVGRDVAG